MMQKGCFFSDLRHAALATIASRAMIVARRLFGLAADPAVAIRINVVQPQM